ncbi:hypothetical protein C900_01700 [Fulvivirga imtechensis AK7]|uniref:Glycosyl transferase family 1 domain-containing protein n=2 Tax=Fulvivirga TaxID=396811 RepID=L8JU41_9BACT|nr:hypothetical protein C900_01700 [Fulvivirga imtechensis AK7]
MELIFNHPLILKSHSVIHFQSRSLFRFIKKFKIFHPLNVWKFFYIVYQIIKKIKKEKVDILYAHSIQSILYCIIPKMMTRIKLIWHVRDNPPFKLIYKISALISDEAICVSEYINRQVPGQNKKTIYNAVNTKDFTPASTKSGLIHQELQLNPDKKLVAQIGQLVPWKNHPLFILAARDILKEYKNVHFLIVGEDLFNENERYNDYLKKLVQNTGMESHISFLGYKHNIKEYMREIDILIHPATTEPFGRVLIEAMALEKPVIAVNSGSPPEIVLNNKTGYVINANNIIPQLKEKAIQLLANEHLIKSMGKAGRMRAEDVFNIDKHVMAISELVEK